MELIEVKRYFFLNSGSSKTCLSGISASSEDPSTLFLLFCLFVVIAIILFVVRGQENWKERKKGKLPNGSDIEVKNSCHLQSLGRGNKNMWMCVYVNGKCICMCMCA